MFVRACVCVCLFACLFACLCVCVCPLLAYASSACPCACHATVVPVQGGRRSHQAPVYVRALFDYNADEDAWMPCVNGGTSFAKGDILEVFALTIMERQSVCARVCVRACVCVRVCACVCRSLPSPFPLSVPTPNVHARAWRRSWIKPTTSGGKRESAAMRCVIFFFIFSFSFLLDRFTRPFGLSAWAVPACVDSREAASKWLFCHTLPSLL